jgi:hypothetical protein
MQEMADVYEKNKISIQQDSRVAALTNVEMPSSWNLSQKGREAIQLAVGMAQTKHGLYAAIPMLCKGAKCPYSKVCPLVNMDAAPEGERCPLEIAMILQKYEEYKDEFGIDEKNIVDMNLTKDLIDCDIQIFRSENKMAVDGDFVEEYVITVTEGGDEIKDNRISKAAEYKEKIQTKKHKILSMMNSTRKDKAGDKLTVQLDPSTYAAQLMKQAASMSTAREEIIEADFTESDE